MGWGNIPWYTITDDSDKDFGVDEWHGHNVFFRDENDKIFRTYLINNRRDEAMAACGTYLDITPLGRQEYLGRLTGGLPADATVQVVALARHLRQRGCQVGQRSGQCCRDSESVTRPHDPHLASPSKMWV